MSSFPSSTSTSSIIARVRAVVVLVVLLTTYPPSARAFNVAPPPRLSSRSSLAAATTTPSPSSFVADVVARMSPSSSRMMRRGPNSFFAIATSSPSSSSEAEAGLSSSAAASEVVVVSLSLEKPLGLVLEESDDGLGGAVVAGVNEGGSAHRLPSSTKESLLGLKISSVMGVDVSRLSFDDVMDAIVGAPSPVDVSLRVPTSSDAATTTTTTSAAPPPVYEAGAVVDIVVQQPNASPSKPDIIIKARVGDNLRKTLLSDPRIELYRGLKKKLGNCGGGGQCGFCAVELIDDSPGGVGGGAWGTRSDYEAKKIGRNGGEGFRLACMNNIAGPATVRTL
jgi:hypothetical protein